LIDKIIGKYKDPIWFYIKIFIDDDNNIYSCFIENEMIYSSKANMVLMRHIRRKLKIDLDNVPVNWIDFCKIDTICNYLKELELNVHKDVSNKKIIIITINGKLSERDINKKSKNIK